MPDMSVHSDVFQKRSEVKVGSSSQTNFGAESVALQAACLFDGKMYWAYRLVPLDTLLMLEYPTLLVLEYLIVAGLEVE